MQAAFESILTVLKYIAVGGSFILTELVFIPMLTWFRKHFVRRVSYGYAADEGKTAEGTLVYDIPDFSDPDGLGIGCMAEGTYSFEVDGNIYTNKSLFWNSEYAPKEVRIYWKGDDPSINHCADESTPFDFITFFIQIILFLAPFATAHLLAVEFGIVK